MNGFMPLLHWRACTANPSRHVGCIYLDSWRDLGLYMFDFKGVLKILAWSETEEPTMYEFGDLEGAKALGQTRLADGRLGISGGFCCWKSQV